MCAIFDRFRDKVYFMKRRYIKCLTFIWHTFEVTFEHQGCRSKTVESVLCLPSIKKHSYYYFMINVYHSTCCDRSSCSVVGLSVTSMCCAKTAARIKVLFWVETLGNQRHIVLVVKSQCPHGEGEGYECCKVLKQCSP